MNGDEPVRIRSARRLGRLVAADLGRTILVHAADGDGAVAAGRIASIEHYVDEDGVARTVLLLTDTAATADRLGVPVHDDGEWTRECSCWVGYPSTMYGTTASGEL